MPYYPFDHAGLRSGLNSIRLGRYQLAAELGKIQQMTDEQVESEYGFAPGTGATVKAELDSGIGKLLANDPGLTSAQAYAAVVQMLNQFG